MEFNLQCEYQQNPIGVDNARPRFNFPALSEKTGHRQVSYRIYVAIDAAFDDLIWDSGQTISSRSVAVEYDGPPLASFAKHYWRVVIKDNFGDQHASEISWFITGMQQDGEWSAKWIGPASISHSAVRLQACYKIQKTVRNAIAAVAGLGYYQLYINGDIVGNELLCNAQTDYSKTILYRCYDIRALCSPGVMTVTVDLAKGWYNCPQDSAGASGSSYCLAMQIHVSYMDGSVETFYTQKEGWKYTFDTPILSNSIYGGEVYDARREQASDWNWHPVAYKNSPGGKLSPECMEPVRATETLPCLKIYEVNQNRYVLDFGQNIAGVIRMKIKGEYSQRITLRHAELLYEDQSLNRTSIRGASAQDTYIFGKHSEIVYAPRFTYHGFRYAEIEGLMYKPDKDDFQALVIHSDVKKTVDFECGNDVINSTFRNILWTERDNIHGLPTDCPQRDERLGWLNDMTVRAEGAMYSYKLASIYAKWCRDIADTQGDCGAIADTAPHRFMGQSPADAVCSCFVLIPWLLYVLYGDRKTLRTLYQHIKKWVDYLADCSTDYIVDYSYYGDWASPYDYTQRNSIGAGAVSAITPGKLVSTGHQYLNCVTLSKIAAVLGEKNDSANYMGMAKKIACAFNKAYYKDGTYADGSQASNALPLYLGIAPDPKKVALSLVNEIKQRDYHFTTGNLCTRYMLEALSEYGESSVAFMLASQTTYPSYGYMLEKGATTIWERWEYVTGGELAPMASHNHPMYGSICLWYYKYLLGIRPCEDSPGFSKFSVKPAFIPELGFVKGAYYSPMGKIIVSWRYASGKVNLNVEVPFNCVAEIFADKAHHVAAGKHEFVFELPTEN